LDSVVLVEGQMDLILSHQSGVINAVASSGTALTGDHLTLIKRFTKNLVLAFDADDAGLTAAYRAIGLALSQDMSVRIAALPRGMDPADLALKDQKAWQGAVKDAKQVVDFYLELLPSLYADKAELRKKVSQVIVPFIAELRSAIDQGHYVGQTAKLLGIKDDPVWDEVKKIRAPETSGATPKGHTEHDSAGQNVLARHTRITGIIQGILLWQEAEKEPRVKNIASYRARLAKILEAEHPPGLAAAPLGATGKESELIFEAETRFGETPHLEEEIKTLFKSLEDEILRDSLAKKWAELKNAEARGDADGAQKLLAEYQEFSHKLHQK
jgi:DNA primase